MENWQINQAVYEAHQRLSASSARFIDFVRQHPEAQQRSHFHRIVHHPHFNYYLLQPWPTFINEKTKNRITEAGLHVLNLIRSIPERVFDYDTEKISRYYEIPEERVRSLLEGVDNEYLDSLIGRGDFIMSAASGLKCIEYNVVSSLGGWEQDFLETEYSNIPVISHFLRENRLQVRRSHFFPNLFDHIAERAVKHWNTGAGAEINMVLMFTKKGRMPEGTLNFWLRDLYKTALRKQNGPQGTLFFGDIHGVRVVDHVVMYGNERIHAMYEMRMGDIPSPVLEAFKAGNLHLYNGPISDILSSKLNIAILSENQDTGLFNREEQEIIRQHIPWTRKLVPGETTYGTEKVKLEEFLLSNREKLLIKSPLGCGGFEVFMGSRTQASQWKTQVENALKEKNWVVQEYIRPDSLYYQHGEFGCIPHQVVWGVFIFGSRYGGGFVRVLPEQGDKFLVNLNQGAEQSTALEVDE
jgi:hypothetical protein